LAALKGHLEEISRFKTVPKSPRKEGKRARWKKMRQRENPKTFGPTEKQSLSPKTTLMWKIPPRSHNPWIPPLQETLP
jgi:hypothetical protein